MQVTKTLIALAVAAGFATASFAQTPAATPAVPNAKVESTAPAAEKSEAAKPAKAEKHHKVTKKHHKTTKKVEKTETKTEAEPAAK